MNNWIVIKFGGTSVSSRQKWDLITNIIKQHNNDGYQVALVHSAVSDITNYLEKLIENHDTKTFSSIQKKLLLLTKDLEIPEKIVSDAIVHLEKILGQNKPSLHQQAEILSWGETVTHKMGLKFLEKNIPITPLDPKKILISSSNDNRSETSRILSAKCEVSENKQLIKSLEKPAYSMPGFIAADNSNNTVVLGRGGSDTSAAYLAVLLNAKKLEIWTDVHGIFSANPHIISTARLLKKTGYQEAREIAASGGKVLHPRCILPVEQHHIPLHIKNTNYPDAPGTILGHDYSSTSPRVRAINTRHNITLVSMESMSMWHQAGFLGSVFNIYKELGLSIDLISTAQTNVTVSLDSSDNIIDKKVLDKLTDQLSRVCQVELFRNCSAVTLVGYRIRALADKIAPVITSFSDQRIYMVTQSSNDLNQTIVVEQDQADKLIRALHDVLVTQSYNAEDFGPTWEELLQQNTTEKPAQKITWWQRKKNMLIDLAQSYGSCYVYDLQTVYDQITRLKKLQAIDKIYYASKANSHPDILKLMHENGIGIETVSPGEVLRTQKTISHISPDNILFTPNFAPRKEYQFAIENRVRITIDNIYILRKWGKDFTGLNVILRLDPGHGGGHHRYVRTAGEQAKFGIHHSELSEAAKLCDMYQIAVDGLHAHSGSGILNYENWQRVIAYLVAQLDIFPSAHIINIGGGMGIQENPSDIGLNMSALDSMLMNFKKKKSNIQIWIEPGRYLVAHSGVLLSTVTQTKWKGRHGYIGVETGMNSLIRPALYGSWHNIVNLSKINQPKSRTANIVGPLCESADILGIDRKMPETQSGDIILIANTGAYGASMSSHYNLRKPAEEHILPII